MLKRKEALLIVDPQIDFCPGGALAVKGGDEIMEPLNRLIKVFNKNGLPVFVSRDWHKRSNLAHMGEGKWPLHCIQGTRGAEFHPRLKISGSRIITKGDGDSDDGYSAFEGKVDREPLLTVLKRSNIEHLVVGGLATDYCVKATVLDARKHGFGVKVLSDAIRSVCIRRNDGVESIIEMIASGAKMTTVAGILVR